MKKLVIALILLVFSWPCLANNGVSFNGSGVGSASGVEISLDGSIGTATGDDVASSGTVTISSHTNTAGDVLYVCVSAESSMAVIETEPTVTWNSVSLTRYTAADHELTYNGVWWFYLTSPTQTTADVVVTNEDAYAMDIGVFAIFLVNGGSPNGASTNDVSNAATVSAVIDPPTSGSWILSGFSAGQPKDIDSWGAGQTNTTELGTGSADFEASTEDNDASDTQSLTYTSSATRIVISSIAVPPN